MQKSKWVPWLTFFTSFALVLANRTKHEMQRQIVLIIDANKVSKKKADCLNSDCYLYARSRLSSAGIHKKMVFPSRRIIHLVVLCRGTILEFQWKGKKFPVFSAFFTFSFSTFFVVCGTSINFLSQIFRISHNLAAWVSHSLQS